MTMESVDRYDRYLDPPDYPVRSDCDSCGVEFDTGDLKPIGGQWICDDCARENELVISLEYVQIIECAFRQLQK